MQSYLKPESALMIWNLSRKLPGEFADNKELIDQTLAGYLVTPDEIAKTSEDNTTYDWSDKLANKFSKSLSENQTKLLKAIKNNGNKATMADARNVFKGEAKPSQSLAGVISCLTRKCDSYDIPYLVVWDSENDVYTISKEALPFISKYLS